MIIWLVVLGFAAVGVIEGVRAYQGKPALLKSTARRAERLERKKMERDLRRYRDS